jgi:hypothetical protein
MKIEITADNAAVKQYFDNLSKKHLPFARFMAVNKIAMEVKQETYSELKTLFDRPRPDYTLQSLDVTTAKYADFRSQREVSARVDVTDFKGQDKYIGHHFTGEDRRFKRFEARLRYANILPAGMWAVPGKAMPIDQYGNADRSVITQILRYLQAFNFVGDTQNMKDAGKKRLRGKYARASSGAGFEMIVSQGKGTRGPRGKVQNLAAGIYFRYQFATGSSLKPMLIFVRKKGGYRRRVFLDLIGDQVMAQKGAAIIANELAEAISKDKQLNRTLAR